MDHLELKNDLRSSPLFSEDFKKTCTVLEFLIYSGKNFMFSHLKGKGILGTCCAAHIYPMLWKSKEILLFWILHKIMEIICFSAIMFVSVTC